MARPTGEKTLAVREYLASHPEATAKEVVETLAKDGMTVTSALYYKVKGAMAERKHRKKRVVKAAMAAHSPEKPSAKTDAITMIREVKSLAAKAGGYSKLKELVEALAE